MTYPALAAELEARVSAEIPERGCLETYRAFIGRNDALIRGSELSNGGLIAAERAAIHTALVRHWAGEQHRRSGYDRPFAIVALGGTGRAELAPCSDLDFAFLFDDALEGNRFLIGLQQQLIESDEFREAHGFGFQPLPFNLDDAPQLADKQLNSFVDLRPVYDPGDLAARFRERIRATYDPFEHFLHVRSFWKDRWEKAASEFERLDAFDIKNDGLRIFLAGIWTLAGKRFQHSHEIYQALKDPRDLEAYHLLIRVRCFIHSRRRIAGRPSLNGNHVEDILRFEDLLGFDEMLEADAAEGSRIAFADHVRERLLWARRRVARFARAIIEQELQDGRSVRHDNPIVYGAGGLRHATSKQDGTPEAKSRAALALLLASQHYGVPIDPGEQERTFRDAGDWLTPVPELASLFYEPRGSLADSFTYLSQFEGAEERLFPGYAKFEASFDERVMTEREVLRGALERRKIRALEGLVAEGRQKLELAVKRERLVDPKADVLSEVEAALLGSDELAAIKLALKTKRLPVTPEDAILRDGEGHRADDRYTSGFSAIPLAKYYAPYRGQCGFSEETVKVAEFLVANRRAFKDWTAAGLNPTPRAEQFARLCGEERLLRCLFVFTCADRAEWESPRKHPARWFLTRELYRKAMQVFRPRLDPAEALAHSGFAPEEQAILRDFGPDFFTGVYGPHAVTFGSHLLTLAQQTTLFAEEVTDPTAFLLKLRQATDPMSVWIRHRLSAGVQSWLGGWQASDVLPPARRTRLFRELNDIMKDGSLAGVHGSMQANWSPETLRLIEAAPGQEDAPRLRRLLLEDAYPAEVSRSASDPGPRAMLLRDGASLIIGVAARDFRGLAACITGALWRQGMLLRQAHLFSAMHYALGLDFFHVEPIGGSCGNETLRFIEEAIRARRYIAPEDEADLVRLTGQTTLQPWQPGEFLLRHETSSDTGGLVYALAYKVFRHLQGNIFGLLAHATRGSAYVSIYLTLPPEMELNVAHRIVVERFGAAGPP